MSLFIARNWFANSSSSSSPSSSSLSFKAPSWGQGKEKRWAFFLLLLSADWAAYVAHKERCWGLLHRAPNPNLTPFACVCVCGGSERYNFQNFVHITTKGHDALGERTDERWSFFSVCCNTKRVRLHQKYSQMTATSSARDVEKGVLLLGSFSDCKARFVEATVKFRSY